MATNISDWATTAAGNNTGSAPDYPTEGQTPSSVNDTIRNGWAAVARWYEDTNGTLVTGGTGNAYTLTTNNAHAALADQSLLVFRIDRANTSAVTLNVDGLGAKAWQSENADYASGDLVANQICVVAYNATNDQYDTIGGIQDANAAKLDANNVFTNAAQTLSNAAPELRFSETDATANNGNWLFSATGENFVFRAYDDAFSSSSTAITFTRTGTTVDEIQLDATSLDFNGALDLSGRAIVGTGSSVADPLRLIAQDSIGDCYAGFYENDETTRKGYIGYGSSINNNIQIVNEEASGHLQLFTDTTVRVDIDENGDIDFQSAAVTTDNDTADEVGYKGTPLNTQNGNYTLVLGDAGETIYKASGGSGETITIPANASVAFPVGTQIDMVNNGGGDLTVAITTDTLTWSLDGSTGSRTLADHGWAVIKKVSSTEWFISGTGLS